MVLYLGSANPEQLNQVANKIADAFQKVFENVGQIDPDKA